MKLGDLIKISVKLTFFRVLKIKIQFLLFYFSCCLFRNESYLITITIVYNIYKFKVTTKDEKKQRSFLLN